ncbi:fructosamine kinase [Labedella populi]|uniref:Fructosamine kinase n=1 Tax=Labedella populi TaxID=2498850 RepID=A0A444Q2A3_9MICO|nr:fructosamine kinase family protein [Labedella populi]RWZ55385.1 fructosamine kinase [Labedella populi]
MSTAAVVKSAPAAADAYPAEAAGLRWLAAAGGARVVRVLDVSSSTIMLERIDESPPTPEAARRFGEALATTHRAGAPAFGSPPAGWTGRLFIGRREMPASSESSWGSFYARTRVLPFLAVAERVGTIGPDGARLVRDVCDAIAGGALDDDEPPARIHGDLWSGNVLWGADGVVIIDPAAHGGHRETDLAMLALFGCPFLDEVVSGYDGAHPLGDGWRERVPLHQLHPLAVHAAGHGPAYGRALAEAAGRVAASLL